MGKQQSNKVWFKIIASVMKSNGYTYLAMQVGCIIQSYVTFQPRLLCIQCVLS